MTQPTPLATHLTLEEAIERLLDAALPIRDTQTLATSDALGRVLAEPLVSALNVPPWANSAMDGYAVRAADVPEAGTRLPVRQRIAAGSQGKALEPGTAARIFTGAPMPKGADAVVMQEDCEAAGDEVHRPEGPPRPASGCVPSGRTCAVVRSCWTMAPACRPRLWGWPPPSAPPRSPWCAARVWRCSPPAMNW